MSCYSENTANYEFLPFRCWGGGVWRFLCSGESLWFSSLHYPAAAATAVNVFFFFIFRILVQDSLSSISAQQQPPHIRSIPSAEAVKAGGRPPGSGSAERCHTSTTPTGSVGGSLNCEKCLEAPAGCAPSISNPIGSAEPHAEPGREQTRYVASTCDNTPPPPPSPSRPSLGGSQQTRAWEDVGLVRPWPPAGDFAGST